MLIHQGDGGGGPSGTDLARALGDTFAEEWQDVVGFWVAAEHRLREEQFTVEMYVEDASRSRDDLDNVD